MATHLTTRCATERRLVEAAGDVFARRGYRAASVREICRKAGGANVAAVSYYFGSKERLYAAALQYAHRCALASHPPGALALDAGARPELRLRDHLRTLLLRFLDTGRPAWHSRLMAQEMAEPTAAMGELIDKGIRPQYELLLSIVRDLGRSRGVEFDERTLRRCTYSIVGQCLYYRYAHDVIVRLNPDETFARKDIDRLVEHIADFSLGGLAALAARATGGSNGSSPAANGSSGSTGATHTAARRRPRLDTAASPARKARKD